jgi:hypothetical protein
MKERSEEKKLLIDTAFRTFIRICSVFKNERLSTNIKLTHHKAPRSVMLGIYGKKVKKK